LDDEDVFLKLTKKSRFYLERTPYFFFSSKSYPKRMWSFVEQFLGLGLEPHNLKFGHVALRALIVFIATLIVIKVAHKRFLARRTAFDVVLGFILASMLARAVNGSAPFFATMGAACVLVLLHRLLASASAQSLRIETFIKGTDEVLVRDGVIDDQAMKRHAISRKDLEEDLYLDAHTDHLERIRTARLERSGDISAVRKSQIFTIDVKEGVQTIRIEVEG
jgi:uncharacterized membrane protein YcaP (DUF421 family)